MKIGESSNSVVARLTREELFKSMGSLSTWVGRLLVITEAKNLKLHNF